MLLPESTSNSIENIEYPHENDFKDKNFLCRHSSLLMLFAKFKRCLYITILYSICFLCVYTLGSLFTFHFTALTHKRAGGEIRYILLRGFCHPSFEKQLHGWHHKSSEKLSFSDIRNFLFYCIVNVAIREISTTQNLIK